MGAVSTKRLVKKYGSHTVLRGLDLEVVAGEMFALLGPNGSGKTTLFRILATLISPDGGSARVGGSDVVREPASVRAKIGVVFQSPSLDKKLTAHENLRYGGALYGMHGIPLRQRISELASSLRLEEKLDALVETLSGGQQRRVEIAKCLLARPEILLLDEPSTGLDPSARMDLWALVGNLRSSHGMTVVFTSHLMDESARADRVGILSEGSLVCVESPADLLAAAGPEVLRVATTDVPGVAGFLRAKCGLDPHSLEGEVRVSASEAHSVAARLAAEMPSAIASTTISKPTLEDVFLFKTGKRLDE
ncbi:MAG: ABC transporter ATP-binding protein [Terrimicrobiaceae bacterium]